MANSVNPDQTASAGAVLSGFSLFALVAFLSQYLGFIYNVQHIKLQH